MNATIINDTDKLLNSPLPELIDLADELRKTRAGSKLHKCAILNARSGLCAEDCRFCAQSSKHNTHVDVYKLKSADQIVRAAEEAKNIGAERFGIVTSGNKLSPQEIETIAAAISQIIENIDIIVCGSLGALDISQLQLLKNAGLARYHHNIETSKRFYSQIVTTHNFDERLKTIAAAKHVGLEVCSGGIIGMGENWHDRIDMARTLKELNVDSVPINILVPIKGTPLQDSPQISIEDAVRTICIFRIFMPDKTIKIAAGREAVLGDSQLKAFAAGANGMLIGGYLTVKGASLDTDNALIERIENLWND
jgi:biotin synthase